MRVEFHPHALVRLSERGATEQEVREAVQHGERVPAKLGRVCFRRNFLYNSDWKGRHCAIKQVEAYAVQEVGAWLVLTVIVKYF